MYQYTKPTRILGTIVLINEAIHRDRLSQGDGTNCDRRKKSGMAAYGRTARTWSPSGSGRKHPTGARRPWGFGAGKARNAWAQIQQQSAPALQWERTCAFLL